eukprot:m.54360 g.54360  ORF g.54360 m.54360 type:complete len:781 (+) comp15507_c0_seq1:506-2848(+)
MGNVRHCRCMGRGYMFDTNNTGVVWRICRRSRRGRRRASGSSSVARRVSSFFGLRLQNHIRDRIVILETECVRVTAEAQHVKMLQLCGSLHAHIVDKRPKGTVVVFQNKASRLVVVLQSCVHCVRAAGLVQLNVALLTVAQKEHGPIQQPGAPTPPQKGGPQGSHAWQKARPAALPISTIARQPEVAVAFLLVPTDLMVLQLAFPPLEDGREHTHFAHQSLSDFTVIDVEPVGRWYEVALRRRARGESSCGDHDDNPEAGKAESSSEDEADDNDDDEELLVTIDGDWKNQDHYAYLGLGNLRWRCTDDDIKKAYKKQVLKHHPDKKGTADTTPEEAKQMDAYFNCIQKAYELLSDPEKRKLYDSVDDVDDTVPPICKTEKEFYGSFGPAFARNARWFVTQPAPLLGDANSTKEEVMEMYDFWYSTPTWREFGFFDEEDVNQAECREEKRWMERRNKAARKKKKKAENARMILLVDNARACDPRLKRFREEEKAAKAERKRQIAAQKKAEEDARLEKIRKEEEERQKAELAAKEEAKKNNEAAKKMRKNFNRACKKRLFMDDDGSGADFLSPEGISKNDTETLRTTLEPERLQAMVDIEDRDAFVAAVKSAVEALHAKEEAKAASARAWSVEEQKLLEDAMRAVPKDAADRWDQIAARLPGRTKKDCVMRVKECAAKVKEQKEKEVIPSEWTKEEQSCLVKAASKVYPPGTQGDRWDQIAEYVKTHARTTWKRPSKDVIAMVNAMKNVGAGLQKQHQAPAQGVKVKKDRSKPSESIPSERV